MLIVMLNDEYSLVGLKAPPDAATWTEAQIQRFFDSGGKVRPTAAMASAARCEEEQEKQEGQAAQEEQAEQEGQAGGPPWLGRSAMAVPDFSWPWPTIATF